MNEICVFSGVWSVDIGYWRLEIGDCEIKIHFYVRQPNKKKQIVHQTISIFFTSFGQNIERKVF